MSGCLSALVWAIEVDWNQLCFWLTGEENCHVMMMWHSQWKKSGMNSELLDSGNIVNLERLLRVIDPPQLSLSRRDWDVFLEFHSVLDEMRIGWAYGSPHTHLKDFVRIFSILDPYWRYNTLHLKYFKIELLNNCSSLLKVLFIKKCTFMQ